MKLSDALSREELRALSQTSNWRGGLMLGGNLVMLALALTLSAVEPLFAPLSILLIAGQQLAFAIVMHDCAHKALFRTPWLNEFAGKWIGGAAIDAPFLAYRAYHFEHHKHAGTDQDPDQGLVKNYPVSPDSLRRKFIRDLTGQTGIKEIIGSWRAPTLAAKAPFLAFHIVLAGLLALTGALWTYALWWIARIFIFPAIMRMRNIGEHGVAMDRYDIEPRRNTHTTKARWWEVLTVAPNNVNYHLEHHMFASVPPYHLPKLHKLLAERGYYEGYECVTEGYPAMLRKAVRG
jgi:fatty acid desaturase